MTKDYVVSLAEARRRKSSNGRARWRVIADDFAAEVWPQVSPSFRIRPGQVVFTIGSCFARNIETHLESLGCKVPMMDFSIPPEEWDGQPRAAMNRFHPPAFEQCLEWTAAIADRDGRVTWSDCEPLAFDVGDGQYFDLDMASASPVSKARFIERRQHVFDIFRQAFSADCLMLTPGLIEAWRDLETGLYLYDAPHHKRMLATPDRWAFEILGYEKCLAAMLRTIDIVRSRNPAVNVLLTTSPVPMIVTFSGNDIRIANTHSKAVLRAVCGTVPMERALTDYFPSYESVTLSFPTGVWKADRVHVSQGFIGKIVGHMLDQYLEGVEDAARSYQRALTLISNGDYAEAEAAARAALEARPDHFEARALLAESLLRQRKWAAAEEQLAPLVELDSERADLMVGMARAIGGQDRLADAMAWLERALALSSITLADLRLAKDLLSRAPADAAAAVASRAVELFPRHVEAYPMLIDALLRAGRKQDAIAALRRSTSLSKPPTALMQQLAEFLADAGEVDEAWQMVDRVLSSDPKNKSAAALRDRLAAAMAIPPTTGPG